MILALPPFTVDLVDGRALGPEGSARLTPTEVALLRYLAEQGGVPVPRDELLQHVWELHPATRTRTVDTTVRRLRTKIESDPTEPRWLLTSYGRGYRLALPSPASAHPPAMERPPPAAPRMVGRASVLDDLLRCLDTHGLVTLTGPAGMGKTRLALAAAAARPSWWVPAHEVTTPVGLLHAMASASGHELRAGAVEPTLQALAEALGRSGRMLVLDNLEQAVNAAAACIPALRSHGVPIISTSQVRLQLAEEHAVVVPPLAPPDGATLLWERARALGAWRMVAPDDVALQALSARLDGLPLALELAAGRAPLHDPQTLLAQTDAALDLVTGRRRDTRHSALTASLDAAWARLEPRAQRALARLAATRGGFAPMHALRLMAEPDAADAEELLLDLMDHSLVHVSSEQPVRLDIYGVIRRYAVRQLPKAHQQAQRDHRALYLAVAEAAAEQGDLPTLGRELDNILAQGPVDDVAGRARALIAVDPYFTAHGPHAQHVATVTEALSLSDRLPSGLRARVAILWARLQVSQGAAASAEAVKSAEAQACDPTSKAHARGLRARLSLARGDHAAAREAAREAEVLATSCGARSALALLRGEIEQAAGAPRPAEAHVRRAIDLAKTAGHAGHEAAARTILGNILADLGRAEDALRGHRDALAAYRALGAPRRVAAALSNVGNLLLASGDAAGAMQAYDETLALVRERGQELDEAVALTNAGCALIGLGRYAEAEAALARSAHIQARRGVVRGQGIALGNRAIAAELAGRGTPTAYDEALTCLQGIDRRAELYFRAYRGGLALERGDLAGLDDLAIAAELAADMGDPAADHVIALCRCRDGADATSALQQSEGVANADVRQARALLLRLLQV